MNFGLIKGQFNEIKLHQSLFWGLMVIFRLPMAQPLPQPTLQSTTLESDFLGRKVTVEIVLPPNYHENVTPYPVLFLNDGQDLKRLHFVEKYGLFVAQNPTKAFVVVAIHADSNRMQEYGVAATPDYKNRGARAGQYTRFMVNELMPWVRKKYHLSTDAAQNFVAGFSLGGLSAFDLAWHNDGLFGKVGVFSGSFWWRKKAYEDGYDDHNDRIMQVAVRQTTTKPAIKIWLQTGTDDEKDDRNHNGVIDSIEDTLDLIAELEKKGFGWNKDLKYLEVPHGQHNPETWGRAMPDFFAWLFQH